VFIQLAQSKSSVFMAWWLVREKRVPVMIVELQEEATLAVEKRPARVMLRRELFARPALRSGRLARAFFAPGRQL